MMMSSKARRRQAIAARIVALATLGIILLMPKLDLDRPEMPVVMSFASATVQPQAVN